MVDFLGLTIENNRLVIVSDLRRLKAGAGSS